MKRIYFLLIAVSVLTAATSLQAQTDRRTPQMTRGTEQNRQTNIQRGGSPQLTVRAQTMNELLTQDVGNARWLRIIYRELDMLQEKNAPLYYPVIPVRGTGNLFATIFSLAVEGILPIYKNPLNGDAVFDDDHLLDLKTGLLDPYEIMYETVRNPDGTTHFVINEVDVPSELVKSFLVKEAWYFDQNNSIYDVKILALCPVVTMFSDFGGEESSSMFWVLYEDLRPYVSSTPIMTSNINNARTFTIDDYFRRRMYDGEIIKAENLMNLSLQAYAETPEDLQRERERIEGELVAFEKALWFQPDSARLAGAPNKKATRSAARTTKVKQEKAPAAPRNTAPRAERSSSSSATPSSSSSSRSIRR